MHPVATRLVACRSHDSAPAVAAYNNGFAPQLRSIALFYAGKERVHVAMENHSSGDYDMHGYCLIQSFGHARSQGALSKALLCCVETAERGERVRPEIPPGLPVGARGLRLS